MDDQLLREFLAEAEELTEALFDDIRSLSARRAEGRVRREIVGRIFRRVHTIKGSAAAVELQAMSSVAHEMETLLDGVRLGKIAIEDDVLEALEDGASALSQMLSAVSRQENEPSPRATIERLRRVSLKGERAAQTKATQTAALDLLPAEIARTLSEYEVNRLHEALEEGASLFIIVVAFDLVTFDERFRELSRMLGETGELISTLPGLEESAPDQINFRILYATDADTDEIRERTQSFRITTLTELGADAQGETQESEEAESGEDSESTEAGSALPSLSTLVRVQLSELDEMISAAHELLTDTNATLDLALESELGREERTEMEIRAARIRRRFLEFEERLIELRMVRLAQTLSRVARAGSLAARTINKEVDFEILGGDVRLDKSLADSIADPLMHILRNAVDHGIETAGERASAGKDARGHVRLEARAEGSRVRLRVTDDGRGIDPERIARAARERGFIKENARLSQQESLRFIFRQGFSTASSVSSVSGRGVGLDVVEKAVEEIGGELRVWSQAGAGTTFEMTLPTTLALVPALVVHSGGHLYCIDASHITEAGFIAAHDVERIGEAHLIRWRGETTPLVSMSTLLAQIADGNSLHAERLHVVISHAAEHASLSDDEEMHRRPIAVVVDGWDGHQEVLVRGLGRHASNWRGISGATDLRNGQVALMLDLPRLLEMAL